jgi:hypothetical protein
MLVVWLNVRVHTENSHNLVSIELFEQSVIQNNSLVVKQPIKVGV